MFLLEGGGPRSAMGSLNYLDTGAEEPTFLPEGLRRKYVSALVSCWQAKCSGARTRAPLARRPAAVITDGGVPYRDIATSPPRPPPAAAAVER